MANVLLFEDKLPDNIETDYKTVSNLYARDLSMRVRKRASWEVSEG